MIRGPSFHPRTEIPTDPAELRERLFSQDPKLLRGAQLIAEWVTNPAFAERFVLPHQQPRALIVGGFVRDSLLGLHPKDLDLEVYGIEPETLEMLLEYIFHVPPNKVGQAFGILKVPLGEGRELDVSIPRHESKKDSFEDDFLVRSDPQMSIVEAARRRDFTMNTIAADPITGEIFDPFGGIKDLQKGVLRVTDPERFQDDALRVYRATQFVARMNLKVEPESFRLMEEMVQRGQLDMLSVERIAEEWKKLLLKSPRPSVGIELMRDLGIIERDYPELHGLIACPQEHEWHPEGDVWIHTMMVVDAAAKIVKRLGSSITITEALSILVGALCHDLGKPSTTKLEEGRVRSRGHEEAGVEPTRALLKRIPFSNEIENAAAVIAAQHLKIGVFYRELEIGRITQAAYLNIIRKLLIKIHPVSWRVLLAGSEADFRGRALPGVATDPYLAGEYFAEMITRFKLDTIGKAPLLQGRDLIALGIRPGKGMGAVIRRVESLRDEGIIQTREEALAYVESGA